MQSKNIFGGFGLKSQFVNIVYQELMKREWVTLADILCIYYGREKNITRSEPSKTNRDMEN